MMGKLKSIIQAVLFTLIGLTCIFAWPLILGVTLFALLTSFFYLALQEEKKKKAEEKGKE